MPVGRRLWVVAHRWAGLTIAFFLCVAGLTGSLITWNDELQPLTAPAMFVATPPTPAAPPLDPLTLRERAEAATGARIDRLMLDIVPGETVRFYPKAPPGRPALAYDEIAFNPYTGAEQGRRWRTDLTEGWQNVMPFIYRLHYELALGRWMEIAFGIAALIWTLDCFVGFYLTLPPGGLNRRRWRKAWTIRTPVRNAYKFNVDFHTAAGLWLWPVLLVFAWSGVGFNLREQIYDPVMTALTGQPEARAAMAEPATPNEAQRLGWAAALAEARRHAAMLAKREGFVVEKEGALIFQRADGVWQYRVRTDRDVDDRGTGTRLYFADAGGRLLSAQIPSGYRARDTIDSWLSGLHMAQMFGLPYRLFVTVLGLLVTGLSVTGVIIWMRKRSARLFARRHRGAAPVPRYPVVQPAE